MGKQTTSARERVRHARAARDAERKAREKQVDRAAEAYLEAGHQLAKAIDAQQAALVAQGQAVQAMLDLGESLGSVSEYLGVDKADLKAARQAHAERTRTLEGETTGHATGQTDPPAVSDPPAAGKDDSDAEGDAA